MISCVSDFDDFQSCADDEVKEEVVFVDAIDVDTAAHGPSQVGRRVGVAPSGRRAHRVPPDSPEGVARDARAEAIEDVAEAYATPDEPERVTLDVPGGELDEAAEVRATPDAPGVAAHDPPAAGRDGSPPLDANEPDDRMTSVVSRIRERFGL